MEIKRSEVNALETKLESFAKGLPEQEQNVLSWILARAKAATEVEISEAELDSVSGGLADAAGFDDAAAADKITVSGSWAR